MESCRNVTVVTLLAGLTAAEGAAELPGMGTGLFSQLGCVRTEVPGHTKGAVLWKALQAHTHTHTRMQGHCRLPTQTTCYRQHTMVLCLGKQVPYRRALPVFTPPQARPLSATLLAKLPQQSVRFWQQQCWLRTPKDVRLPVRCPDLEPGAGCSCCLDLCSHMRSNLICTAWVKDQVAAASQIHHCS